MLQFPLPDSGLLLRFVSLCFCVHESSIAWVLTRFVHGGGKHAETKLDKVLDMHRALEREAIGVLIRATTNS